MTGMPFLVAMASEVKKVRKGFSTHSFILSAFPHLQVLLLDHKAH